MRVFIGFDLKDETKDYLIRNVQELDYSVTCVPVDNLHCTLAFIGEVDQSQVSQLKGILEQIVFNPFPIEIKEIRNFKKLIIASVSPSKELMSLQNRIAKEARSGGYSLEERPYFPHVTLVRKQSLSSSIRVHCTEIVDEVVLYESILSPRGAKYTKIFRVHGKNA